MSAGTLMLIGLQNKVNWFRVLNFTGFECALSISCYTCATPVMLSAARRAVLMQSRFRCLECLSGKPFWSSH